MRSDLARVGLVVLIGVSALITGLRFLWQDLSDRGTICCMCSLKMHGTSVGGRRC
jgi:hypothetical protein